MSKLEYHPLYDHLPHPVAPHAQAVASAPCAQPSPSASAQRPPRSSTWGGRRRGAGARPGTMNHLKHGQRSALIRHAVNVLAEHKELRPFLLLIARAAVEGEIPQTTRQLIIESLGETTTGMLAATSQLRRLRDGQKV